MGDSSLDNDRSGGGFVLESELIIDRKSMLS